MADAERKLSNGTGRIDFVTEPSRYHHWKLSVEDDVATLTMDVDENAPLFEGYQLKLNSYDLGVDIELADALERLRFEHPAVKLAPLTRKRTADGAEYSAVSVEFARESRLATITLRGPDAPPPATADDMVKQ